MMRSAPGVRSTLHLELTLTIFEMNLYYLLSNFWDIQFVLSKTLLMIHSASLPPILSLPTGRSCN